MCKFFTHLLSSAQMIISGHKSTFLKICLLFWPNIALMHFVNFSVPLEPPTMGNLAIN